MRAVPAMISRPFPRPARGLAPGALLFLVLGARVATVEPACCARVVRPG